MKNKHCLKLVGVITCIITLLLLMCLAGEAKSISVFPGPILKNYIQEEVVETNWDLDLLTYHYTRPANNPVPPSDVFNIIPEIIEPEGKPIITSYTRHGESDRSIVLQGDDFTALSEDNACTDTRVWVYRQTNSDDARLYSAKLIKASKTSIIFTIDENEPYGMYLVWVESNQGIGYPIRINVADMWWIGPKHGKAGDEISVYGRNLAGNDEDASYVYLRKWGADLEEEFVPTPIVAISPEKVTFTIPQGLDTECDYEVWLHNGHGGEYGWTGPQRLSVNATDLYSWTGDIINVNDYKPKPKEPEEPEEPISDDTAAIQAAVTAAKDGDIIYFPSGTYNLVSGRINVTKKLYFKGEDKDNTLIIADSTFTAKEMFYVAAFPHKFSDLKFKSLHTVAPPHFINIPATKSPSGSIIENCIFEGEPLSGAMGSAPINYGSFRDIYFLNNTVTSPGGVFAKSCSQVFVKGNEFTGNWIIGKNNGWNQNVFNSCHEVDFSENKVDSLENDGDIAEGKKVSHRMFLVQATNGMASRHYVGKNEAPYGGQYAHNSGERILFESAKRFYTGSPTNADGTILTFGGVSWYNQYAFGEDKTGVSQYATHRPSIITIQSGKGAGQYRRILTNTTNTLTVDKPWEIPPDSTSVVTIGASAVIGAISDNTISAYPNYSDNENATCGVELFGGIHDFVISRNNISGITYGIYVRGLHGEDNVLESNVILSGVQIRKNNISNVAYGIAVYGGPKIHKPADPPPMPGPVTINTVVQDNIISDVKESPTLSLKNLGGFGLLVGQVYRYNADGASWDGNWLDNTVFEKNTVTDAETAYFHFRRYHEGTVLRKNEFIDTGKYTGTTGLKYYNWNGAQYLLDNQYDAKIGTKYGQYAPGSSLNVDRRHIDFEEIGKGKTPEGQVINVYNAGTAPLEIRISKDADWLNLPLDSMSIADENESTQLIVDVDTTDLEPGKHTATITLEGGDNYNPQKIGVSVIVEGLKITQFTITEGSEGGTIEASIELENVGPPISSSKGILAHFRDNSLVGVKIQDISVETGTQVKVMSLNSQPTTGDIVKLFLWDDINEMDPLVTMEEKSFQD